MKEAGFIFLVLFVILGISGLIALHAHNVRKAVESQSKMAEILPGTYQVIWYKQAGGFMRSKTLTAQDLIKEVKKTFERAQDTIKFEECSDGYIFSRPNWRHARNAEGQKFGYITARRLA